MRLEDLDTKKDEQSDKELDAFIRVLILHDEIIANQNLYRLVQNRMKKMKKKISSISDLRAKADTFAMEAEQDK